MLVAIWTNAMKKIISLLLFISLFAALANAALGFPPPDTGQTQSYTDTFGEDSDYNINPPSYTKLDAQGNELPADAAVWVMVRDNVTGLIWEVKTDDGSINDKDNTYTWQDAQDVFIAELNSTNFGGFSDWRLPSAMELMSIVDHGTDSPPIDTTYFSGTNAGEYSQYWSSTTYASNSSSAWSVNFFHGSVISYNKGYYYYVRGVRGADAMVADFIDNGDGTVTDNVTGLMWQQEEGGSTNWEHALTYCEDLSLAGYTDWRLPNIKELRSIVDDSLYNPAIDTNYFPDAHASHYWSSTTYASLSPGTWYIDFYRGTVHDGLKVYLYYVRAVRGGQNQISGHLVISSPSQASSWDIGGLMSITWETQGITGNVKISLSRQGGKDGTFETIIESTENDGSYDWTVTGTKSVNCMLKIEPIDDSSKRTTQGLFTIYKLKATISGTPVSPTNQTGATLTIDGDYVTHYKYKIDNEETYRDEIPVTTEISLSNLTDGIHTVYVIGRNEVGNWQSEDDATSVSWTVDTTGGCFIATVTYGSPMKGDALKKLRKLLDQLIIVIPRNGLPPLHRVPNPWNTDTQMSGQSCEGRERGEALT